MSLGIVLEGQHAVMLYVRVKPQGHEKWTIFLYKGKIVIVTAIRGQRSLYKLLDLIISLPSEGLKSQ